MDGAVSERREVWNREPKACGSAPLRFYVAPPALRLPRRPTRAHRLPPEGEHSNRVGLCDQASRRAQSRSSHCGQHLLSVEEQTGCWHARVVSAAEHVAQPFPQLGVGLGDEELKMEMCVPWAPANENDGNHT